MPASLSSPTGYSSQLGYQCRLYDYAQLGYHISWRLKSAKRPKPAGLQPNYFDRSGHQLKLATLSLATIASGTPVSQATPAGPLSLAGSVSQAARPAAY